MRNNKTKIFLLVLAGIVSVFIIKDIFTQSGLEDLKGGFTEIAKYRNENNTGPVQQLYVVSISDTTGAQLLEYGNLMPHHKYGTTKVYFFLDKSEMPKELSPGEVNFDAKYHPLCYALYKKGPMGNVELVRNPFHNSISNK